MSRDDVMELARSRGLIVQPCVSLEFISVRAGEVPEGCNEKMRMTSDGAVLVVADGYYWQVGTVEDVKNYLEGIKE